MTFATTRRVFWAVMVCPKMYLWEHHWGSLHTTSTHGATVHRRTHVQKVAGSNPGRGGELSSQLGQLRIR